MSQQQGFTLVEIAVVLVVIGLLLGGVLKGRELITTARVHSLTEQQAGVRSAYRAFVDRYRARPGDMERSAAARAIGADIRTGGDGDGRLHAPSDGWPELNAVWEHLSKAGFIEGRFPGEPSGAAPSGDGDVSPLNAFNSPLVLARHDGYAGGDTPRLVLHLGGNVPATVARAVDAELDDGDPLTGRVRNAASRGEPGPHQSGPGCVDTSGAEAVWDTEQDPATCNPTVLF